MECERAEYISKLDLKRFRHLGIKKQKYEYACAGAEKKSIHAKNECSRTDTFISEF